MTNIDLAKFEIWLANLNPQRGAEMGKVRPVVILQSTLFVKETDATIICPISSKPTQSTITKTSLNLNGTGLEKQSCIVLDQIRAVDNRRLIEKIGVVHPSDQAKINQNLQIILDLI